jgi:rare lipoprotein A
MLLPRPRRNLPWAPKVNDGEEPKGGTMRRVGSALPLEIRAWLVAASAVLFGSLATPPLIKHIGPWQHRIEAPLPELAPVPSEVGVPQQPSQSVNRESKAAREAVHAATPTAAAPRAETRAKPQEMTVDETRPAETGRASWYDFNTATASGEIMDGDALTAAHRTLPLGSHVLVENLANGRSVVVRINDRGPVVKGRIIDVSRAAAESLGMLRAGVAKVRVSRLKKTPPDTRPNMIEASAGR